jgi:hypothetical protein
LSPLRPTCRASCKNPWPPSGRDVVGRGCRWDPTNSHPLRRHRCHRRPSTHLACAQPRHLASSHLHLHLPTMFCSRANARGRVRDWARFRPTPGLNEGQPFDWAGIQTGPGGPRGSGSVPGRYGAKRTSPKGEEKELTLLDRWTCANGKE